jgi:hypothetical protein
VPTRNIVLSRKFVITVSINVYYFQHLTTGTVIASTDACEDHGDLRRPRILRKLHGEIGSLIMAKGALQRIEVVQFGAVHAATGPVTHASSKQFQAKLPEF